jgi:hypothetical protein
MAKLLVRVLTSGGDFGGGSTVIGKFSTCCFLSVKNGSGTIAAPYNKTGYSTDTASILCRSLNIVEFSQKKALGLFLFSRKIQFP